MYFFNLRELKQGVSKLKRGKQNIPLTPPLDIYLITLISLKLTVKIAVIRLVLSLKLTLNLKEIKFKSYLIICKLHIINLTYFSYS